MVVDAEGLKLLSILTKNVTNHKEKEETAVNLINSRTYPSIKFIQKSFLETIVGRGGPSDG